MRGDAVAGASCPDPEDFDQLFDERADAGLRAQLESHLDGCDECREFVAALARYDVSDDIESTIGADVHGASQPETLEGLELERYTVKRQVGTGAMGVVYEGYDRSLERRVALKFMSDQLAGSSAARSRVFKEAKAMARVSHQHVAQVYEAAAVDERVFISMEYVDGPTLTSWLAGRDRDTPWPVIDVFIAIGRGLSAAHEAGVVHRDFKPDNVLIAAGDLPKVVDFGLAATAAPPAGRAEGRALGATVVGVGTPLFMAPEVLCGGRADERSDQFSFCVAMHRALFGAPPFAGNTLPDLVSSVTSGKIAAAPGERTVPPRLRRAIARGLATKPGDRWPTMAALVDALRQCKRARGRRRLALSAVAVAAVGGGLGALIAQPSARPCADGHSELRGAWDDVLRAELVATLQESPIPYAAGIVDTTVGRLDHYAEAWAASRVEVCEATEPGSSLVAADIVKRRLDCLADARRALDAATSLLRSATPGAAEEIGAVLDTLPSVRRCSDVEALMDDVPPPPEAIAAAVGRVRDHLARAKAASSTAAFAEEAKAVAAAEREAEGLRYPPIASELQLARGWSHVGAEDLDAATEEFSAAFSSATRLGRTRVAARAARALSFTLSAPGARLAEGLIYGTIARDLAERVDDPYEKIQAERQLSALHNDAGRPELALQHIDAALALHAADPDSDSFRLADLLYLRGYAQGALGELREAEATFRRAIEIEEEVLGPEHPRVAQVLTGLAAALGALGESEAALVALERAAAITRAAYPPGHSAQLLVRHNIAAIRIGLRQFEAAEADARALLAQPSTYTAGPEAARIRINLSSALLGQGRASEAAVEARAALETFVATQDKAHPDILLAKEAMAMALAESGNAPAAEALADELLVAREERYGPDHPDVLRTRILRATQRRGEKGLAIAEDELRANLARLRTVLGPVHDHTLTAWLALASTLGKQGKLEQAEAELRAALAHEDLGTHFTALFRVRLAANLIAARRTQDAAAEVRQLPPAGLGGPLRAEARFVESQIAWAAGRQAEARAHAEAALGFYETVAATNPAERVRVWIEAHPASD
ncbi:MAG: protein kinase [Myxococcota bacterium]